MVSRSEIKDPDAIPDADFGFSVDTDEGTIVAGSFYVFERDLGRNNNRIEHSFHTGSDLCTNARFGESVSLSENGPYGP